MRCLSLWQPWASLLVHGRKRVETRSWELKHRGPLVIHAAKKWTAELHQIASEEPFREQLEQIGNKLPFGALVGVVDVVACFPTEGVWYSADCTVPKQGVPGDGYKLAINGTEHAFGDYMPGRYAILCDRFRVFKEPIPYRGSQGLVNVSDELIAEALKS